MMTLLMLQSRGKLHPQITNQHPIAILGPANENQRMEMARSMGRRLMEERLSDGERLDYLFTLLASRQARDSEREACAASTSGSGISRHRRMLMPCWVEATSKRLTLRSPNHAAWTQVAATVMASDAAILLY